MEICVVVSLKMQILTLRDWNTVATRRHDFQINAINATLSNTKIAGLKSHEFIGKYEIAPKANRELRTSVKLH